MRIFCGIGALFYPTLSEDPDTTAAMAAMSSAPAIGSAARITYDTLIKGIKADGDWAKLDWLVALAPASTTLGEQSGRVNLRKPTQALVAVNSPTFTAGLGFTGDGATSELHTGEVPAVAGNVYALDSAHIGIYANQQGSTGSRVQLGVRSGSNSQIVPSTSTTGFARINDTVALTVPTPSPANRTGGRIMSRTGSAARAFYRNGTSVASDTQASAAVPTSQLSILRVASTYGIDRIAFGLERGG